jgi:release factor glutamine methyltransferase
VSVSPSYSPSYEPPAAVVARLRVAGCVFAEDEAWLLASAATSPAELRAMVARRVDGLPLEQVLGWAGFGGLRIAVVPGVCVPRRRTEFLAERALALTRPGAVVVDLCCGSGAVGALLTGTELYAVDLDPPAVRCARRNLPGAHVYLGDLYDPLPATLRGRVEVLVANAPYVPSDALGLLPREAREHEPRVALDGGVDGLDVLRRVLAGAPGWLAPAGHVLVECGARQAVALHAAARAAGLLPEVVRSAELDATVLIATPAPR